jgi:hypothetical protein
VATKITVKDARDKELKMIFTAELNKLAWQIKKSQNISWGAAFRMAVTVINAPAVAKTTTVFGTWTHQSHRAVAGHFWGLHKAYKELGDTGRSIAMCKVSNTLFAMYEAGAPVNFYNLIRQKGVKESVAQEIADFYVASYEGRPTHRSLGLIQQGATQYMNRVILPRWTF